MRLTNLTWPKAQEYFEKNDMVLISIGSIECHGRHMPLGTDTLIPEHLLEKIEKKSDVLIAPTKNGSDTGRKGTPLGVHKGRICNTALRIHVTPPCVYMS